MEASASCLTSARPSRMCRSSVALSAGPGCGRSLIQRLRRCRGRRPGASRVQRVPTDPQPLREEERQGEEQNREPEDRTVAAPSITHDDIIEEPAAGGKGRCRRDWCPPAREPIRSSRVADGCPWTVGRCGVWPGMLEFQASWEKSGSIQSLFEFRGRAGSDVCLGRCRDRSGSFVPRGMRPGPGGGRRAGRGRRRPS